MKLSASNAKLPSDGHLWRMAPSSVDATITLGQKPGVEVEEQGMDSLPDTLSVPPFSVSIYPIPAQ